MCNTYFYLHLFIINVNYFGFEFFLVVHVITFTSERWERVPFVVPLPVQVIIMAVFIVTFG